VRLALFQMRKPKAKRRFFTLIEMVRFAWKREEQILIFKEK